MSERTKSLTLYASKCVAATGIVFLLAELLGHAEVAWCLVSAVLVLSPDSREAVPFTLGRVGANLVGGACSLVGLLSGLPDVAAICLTYVATIAACAAVGLTASSRVALAAVTILMLQHRADVPLWQSVFERVVAVVVGCLVALSVTLAFHRGLPPLRADDPAR